MWVLDLDDGMELRLPLPAACPVRRTVGCAGPARPPFENCRASTSIFVLPSYKEPTVDALAPRTDEGRE